MIIPFTLKYVHIRSSGKGLGQMTLKSVVDYAFNQLKLCHLELSVYTYNVNALRCYEKSGFCVKELIENAVDSRWNSYTMEINSPLPHNHTS